MKNPIIPVILAVFSLSLSLLVLTTELNKEQVPANQSTLLPALQKACSRYVFQLYVRAGGEPGKVAEGIKQELPMYTKETLVCMADSIKYSESLTQEPSDET